MDAPRHEKRPRFETGNGRLSVWAEAIQAGGELVVYIGGGDRPHVGGISVAGSRGHPISFSLPGHMDYVISSESARRISEASGSACAVICGIHIDRASPEEIDSLIANSRKCVDMLLESLRHSPR
ncbi:MAG TPA: hypothetical protein PKX17_02370 [Candidatus Methanomethylicus sp.]|jgi:hypothetical protein|nr:hypothetical protein [Candidatus Methanomethylicus sp.]